MLKVKAKQASGKDDEKSKVKKGDDDSKADMPEIPLFIADFMGKLLAQEKHCDVEFTVGTENDMKKIKAHRLVLAAHSPLFDTMLYGFSDSSDSSGADRMLEVRINDIKPEAFEDLLKSIYTDKIEVNDNNLEDLTVVGKKYQIEKVQLACATYMEQGINVKNVCQMFESAARLLGDDKFGLAFIRENIEDIFKTDSFLKLSQPRLEVILQDDKLGTDESALLEALIKWGKAECKRQDKPSNLEGLKTILANLLPLVRFPTMDLSEIATVVGPSKLVPDDHLLLLYQYLSMSENEQDNDTKKDDKEDIDPIEKAQQEADEKEKEACIKKLESFYNLKPRSGGFVAKDTKLLDRKYKKDIYKFFNIKQGGRLVLKLLFRGSRDGFNASAFHTKCDGKPKTFTIIKSATYENIFGGYYEGEWATTGSYNGAPSWLFSLVNKYKKPVKLLPTSQSSNVYNNGSYGPTWGGGHDLHINNNMKSNSNYTNPSTYRQFAPGYENLGVVYDNQLLAGAYNFTVDEIECFQVVKCTKVKK